MNVFEGARRIAKLLSVLAIGIALVLSFTTHPYFNRYYNLTPSGGVSNVDDCGARSSFRPHVKGTPDWSRVTICDYDDGPSEISLSDESLKIINSEISSRVAQHLWETIGGTLAGVGVGWIFVWCIGWIVRGFLGIPRGQDYRVSPTAVQE